MNYNNSKVIVRCLECSGSYSVFPYRIGRTKFCSRHCHVLYISRFPKKTFGSRNLGNKRPDLSLRNRLNKGPKSPSWKGENTLNQVRSRTDFKEWKYSVYRRDNFTCVNCNKRGGDLNAHHIKRFKDFPNLRTELSNGVTLCVKCHNRTKGKEPEWENRFFTLLKMV